MKFLIKKKNKFKFLPASSKFHKFGLRNYSLIFLDFFSLIYVIINISSHKLLLQKITCTAWNDETSVYTCTALFLIIEKFTRSPIFQAIWIQNVVVVNCLMGYCLWNMNTSFIVDVITSIETEILTWCND